MNAYDSGDEAVGTIEISPPIAVPTKGENKFIFSVVWNLKGSFKYTDQEQLLESPIFTIPSADECKWYFTVHSIYNAAYKKLIFFSIRLFLHPESNCKAVTTKFRIFIGNKKSCPSWFRYFTFVTKSENSAGALCTMKPNIIHYDSDSDDDEDDEDYHHDSDDDEDDEDYHHDSDDDDNDHEYDLTIVSHIKIKAVIPEHDNFSKNFESLLKNQLCTDVVLSVGKKSYPAHKAILIARSSVFAAMFAHNTVENEGVVQIEDMKGDVVEEMLRFIYTGEVEKLSDLAQDLFIAADKYDLKGLQFKCEEILIANLSSSNALDLLVFAESYNAKEFKYKIMKYIAPKKNILMKKSVWKKFSRSNPKLAQEIYSRKCAMQRVNDSNPEESTSTDDE